MSNEAPYSTYREPPKSTVSDVRTFSKERSSTNPLRSRSTIICLACLGVLVLLNYLCMKSGYFSVEFASMSLLVLREMIASSLNHQAKIEESKK